MKAGKTLLSIGLAALIINFLFDLIYVAGDITPTEIFRVALSGNGYTVQNIITLNTVLSVICGIFASCLIISAALAYSQKAIGIASKLGLGIWGLGKLATVMIFGCVIFLTTDDLTVRDFYQDTASDLNIIVFTVQTLGVCLFILTYPTKTALKVVVAFLNAMICILTILQSQPDRIIEDIKTYLILDYVSGLLNFIILWIAIMTTTKTAAECHGNEPTAPPYIPDPVMPAAPVEEAEENTILPETPAAEQMPEMPKMPEMPATSEVQEAPEAAEEQAAPAPAAQPEEPELAKTELIMEEPELTKTTIINEQPTATPNPRLEQLKQLHEQGLLSDDEYESLKNNL